MIEYDPDEDLPVTLYDDSDEMIDWWDDLFEARMDIDYSPVGEEITLEQWQGLWDWIEKVAWSGLDLVGRAPDEVSSVKQ